MKVAVLGGCGIQGRTAVYDLTVQKNIEEVICADMKFDDLDKINKITNMTKVKQIKTDAANNDQLKNVFDCVDVVVDLLPRHFLENVYSAALSTGTSVVNSNYAYGVDADLDQKAKDAGISIMPECGLDPGIDLIIYGHTVKKFDEINVINSYCGGFPDKKACTNPINYKVSWTWNGVLSSTMRDAKLIRDGKVIDIPAMEQHDKKNIHQIDFPELGKLEAIPNGNAVFFTDLLGVTRTIKETGRYSLRWPGWSGFWNPLKKLGFLSNTPVQGLPCEVSPVQFLEKLLGPGLAYARDERDLVAMLNLFEGTKDGKKIRIINRLLIKRDLNTGLMAMSQGVGYPASIVAQMIANKEITQKGVLSPTTHIPYEKFMVHLEKRGITISEKKQVIN
jgi:lysine 6-dehydrogenase